MQRIEPSGYKGKILICGLNPGWRPMHKQDIWKTEFGEFIEMCLMRVGLDRRDVWMTNLYKYKTEKNRRLTDDEIQIGFMEICNEIGDVKPKVIVLLGNMVREQLEWHCEEIGQKSIAIPHPSYARRNWNQIENSYIDSFKKIKEL